MKRILPLTLLFFLLLHLSLSAQSVSDTRMRSIHWMTYEQAMRSNGKYPKKIFIDLYTDRCGWCKKMDVTSFKDPKVVDYMNKNFYCVKLNAETKDTLYYKGKAFYFRPEYKANELAVLLLNGQMAYPTAVYMEPDLDLITPVAGYQSPEQLLTILHYIGDNIYKDKSWEDYQAGRK